MSDTLTRLTAALSDRYTIERELGEGGMATVYLAEDIKHQRKVAIKLLKPELAAVLGAERFVQEITTTAALQHPHILPLHDSGDADGFLYYVMPFIDGETLRDKLNRETQLGIDEAVKITTEVAEALHYAHTQGVVHRDIKPENILLANGRPMVADFGIAIALSAAAGGRMTETGMSLGTPHYMSPEQATADKEISQRSDVYSLASVLFEMLSGEPPHMGGSAQAIIMKIIAETAAPVTKVRKSVPPNVAAAVSKALEKLPADRFESAKAFAEALVNPGFTTATSGNTRAAAAAGRSWATIPWWWTAIGAVSALLLGLALAGSFTDSLSPFDSGLPLDAPMRAGRAAVPTFSVSPDGSFVVYQVRGDSGATGQFWYHNLKEPTSRPRPIRGTEGGNWTPLISPDGRQFAFITGVSGEMRVTTVEGGSSDRISDIGELWSGEWLADGTIFSSDEDGTWLRWTDPENGPVKDIAVGYCHMPTLISENEVICGGGEDQFATVGNFDEVPFRTRQVIQVATTGERTPLRGSHFRLFSDEYLVYTSIDATIMATKFIDRDSLLVGRSAAMVAGVTRPGYAGAGFYDISDDGTLVYAPGANLDRSVFIRRSSDGTERVLPGEPAAHMRFNISSDDRRLASVVQGIRQQELRLYDLQTGNYEVLDQARHISTPFWDLDDDRLVYAKRQTDLTEVVRRRLSSSAEPELLFQLPGKHSLAQYVDSSLMLISLTETGGGVLSVDVTKEPAQVDTIISDNTYFARVSPDRRWLVWRAQAKGLYLKTWPELGPQWTLMTDTPLEPFWLPNNDLMIHSPFGENFRMSIDPGVDPPNGSMVPWFGSRRMGETAGWSNIIASNGDIIYLLMPDQDLIHYLRVVPDWIKQMKQAVDEAN